MKNKNLRTAILAILAISGWFAIISQFYLILQNDQLTAAEATINFFSFFTILTNILVAVCVTMLLLGIQNRFTDERTVTALAVYIAIVGITYNLILRSIWNPEELQKITDELLHATTPLLFVVYWLVFIPKHNLKWTDAFSWLIYPLAYSIYSLVHGLISNWYPYPFVDPNKIGWASVGINTVFVLITFLVVSWIFIAIKRSRV
jgi:hypothetical protein